MRVQCSVSCDVPKSFRVAQVGSLFDVESRAKSGRVFDVELPDLAEDWTLGAIVGPSGSGKSTIARAAYGEALWSPGGWPGDRAVIDAVCDEDGRPTKEIAGVLSSVGFSSPPAWVRPYRSLSNGEQFLCDLARSLLSERPLVVFDEFTSVVDRTVARIGSAAIAKTLRAGRVGSKKFVAVTCHYDVLEWLQVDWFLDMASGKLARGRLRRPGLVLDIQRATQAVWPIFAPHHYLNPGVKFGQEWFVALVEGRLAACVAAGIPFIGSLKSSPQARKKLRKISRVVVLPDFQGVGLGSALIDFVGEHYAAAGKEASITTSHPAFCQHLARSPRWRVRYFYPLGRDSFKQRAGMSRVATNAFRPCLSAVYVPTGAG